LYNNNGPQIRAALLQLREAIADAGIALQLVAGADVHIAPDLAVRLSRGEAITLNDSRYLLLEPTHHVVPQRLEEHIFGLQTAGFVPVLTHPERLSWIEGHYDMIKRLVYSGVLMQLTAGSFMGGFGRRPRYWAERMLEDGLCHVLATDAHNTEQRAPRLSDAREVVARRAGEEEAANLTLNRPQAILANVAPSELVPPPGREQTVTPKSWVNFFKRVRNRRVG